VQAPPPLTCHPTPKACHSAPSSGPALHPDDTIRAPARVPWVRGRRRVPRLVRAGAPPGHGAGRRSKATIQTRKRGPRRKRDPLPAGSIIITPWEGGEGSAAYGDRSSEGQSFPGKGRRIGDLLRFLERGPGPVCTSVASGKRRVGASRLAWFGEGGRLEACVPALRGEVGSSRCMRGWGVVAMSSYLRAAVGVP
jgi:hypothetical protein